MRLSARPSARRAHEQCIVCQCVQLGRPHGELPEQRGVQCDRVLQAAESYLRHHALRCLVSASRLLKPLQLLTLYSWTGPAFRASTMPSATPQVPTTTACVLFLFFCNITADAHAFRVVPRQCCWQWKQLRRGLLRGFVRAHVRHWYRTVSRTSECNHAIEELSDIHADTDTEDDL